MPGHTEAPGLSQRSSCRCQGDSTCSSVGTGHTSIGTYSREAVGSLASKNTTSTLNDDCVWWEGAPGNLPVTQINTGFSHETGRGSDSVVRSGRHLPTFSEFDSQLAWPHQTFSLCTFTRQAERLHSHCPCMCALGVNVHFASCVGNTPSSF